MMSKSHKDGTGSFCLCHVILMYSVHHLESCQIEQDHVYI